MSGPRAFSAGIILASTMAALAAAVLYVAITSGDDGEYERTAEYGSTPHQSQGGDGCIIFKVQG